MRIFSFRIFLFLIGHFSLQAGWLERKAEGWAWYEDVEKPEEIHQTITNPKEDVIIPPPPPTFAEEATAVKKNLEEKLAHAVLVPNEENVAAYMQEQKKWIDQSADFSRTWAKVLLQQPYMDATLAYPVSQYGIQVQKQIEQDNKTRLIHMLIKDHGLFFFYKGQSKVSQAFSMVVKEFAMKYGWEVIAISSDGTLIEGFVNNQIDNGIVGHFSIETFPSLFIVNPRNKEVTPIAFGLVSVDQIENNIVLQFKELKEKQ